MIDAIAGSAVMPALALTHLTIRLLKNISRYANPQLTRYIRQNGTPFKNKLEELPTKVINMQKVLLIIFYLKFKKNFHNLNKNIRRRKICDKNH